MRVTLVLGLICTLAVSNEDSESGDYEEIDITWVADSKPPPGCNCVERSITYWDGGWKDYVAPGECHWNDPGALCWVDNDDDGSCPQMWKSPIYKNADQKDQPNYFVFCRDQWDTTAMYKDSEFCINFCGKAGVQCDLCEGCIDNPRGFGCDACFASPLSCLHSDGSGCQACIQDPPPQNHSYSDSSFCKFCDLLDGGCGACPLCLLVGKEGECESCFTPNNQFQCLYEDGSSCSDCFSGVDPPWWSIVEDAIITTNDGVPAVCKGNLCDGEGNSCEDCKMCVGRTDGPCALCQELCLAGVGMGCAQCWGGKNQTEETNLCIAGCNAWQNMSMSCGLEEALTTLALSAGSDRATADQEWADRCGVHCKLPRREWPYVMIAYEYHPAAPIQWVKSAFDLPKQGISNYLRCFDENRNMCDPWLIYQKCQTSGQDIYGLTTASLFFNIIGIFSALSVIVHSIKQFGKKFWGMNYWFQQRIALIALLSAFALVFSETTFFFLAVNVFDFGTNYWLVKGWFNRAWIFFATASSMWSINMGAVMCVVFSSNYAMEVLLEKYKYLVQVVGWSFPLALPILSIVVDYNDLIDFKTFVELFEQTVLCVAWWIMLILLVIAYTLVGRVIFDSVKFKTQQGSKGAQGEGSSSLIKGVMQKVIPFILYPCVALLTNMPLVSVWTGGKPASDDLVAVAAYRNTYLVCQMIYNWHAIGNSMVYWGRQLKAKKKNMARTTGNRSSFGGSSVGSSVGSSRGGSSRGGSESSRRRNRRNKNSQASSTSSSVGSTTSLGSSGSVVISVKAKAK